MAQRVYGPVRGAGVQLTEKEGEKAIEPGALGIAGYPGILEKGDVGKLMLITGPTSLEKKTGGIIPDSTLPDNCQHYFKESVGSGALLLVRVTDGNELPAGGYRDFAATGSSTNLLCRRTLRTPLGTLKAKNGGRWGGKERNYTEEFAAGGDLTETTLDTKLAKFTTDEWKGGFIELDGVANSRYAIVGNTAAGVVSVSSDATMATDLADGGDPTNYLYYLVLERDVDKALSYEVRDGEDNPTTEFALSVFVDGNLANRWPSLSVDPTNPLYWVNIINDDGNNDEIVVTDVFTGERTANVRPAGFYGEIATVTETVLTTVLFDYTVSSPTGGNATMAIGTTTDAMLEQIITCTFTAPTAFDVSSDRFGPLATGEALGVEVDVGNKWVPPFTLTAGATPMAVDDTAVISYKPFVADELIGGYVFPDKVNARPVRFRIVDNDHKSITAASGSDMTADGAPADEWMVEAPRHLDAGRDGVSDLADADYTEQAWDVDSSPFNQTFDKGWGLVKFATPGNSATAVQKAGAAYAAAKNHQYRYEVPSTTVTEQAADTYVNDTLGRKDHAVVSFPSYVDIADPEGLGAGKLKRIPATGMIHGREARIANDYLGYHKAGAGVDAILSAVLALPTGDVILNEELLNPRGIGVIKKKKGNFILWGDRTLAIDPTWRFKHHREQMSYYENVLRENFDWIVFALNSPTGRALVNTALKSFFLPEWKKNALDNDFPFSVAASIKIDIENNPAAVKAAGDMVAEISLRLVDVVERLRIMISRAGIFEAAA